MKHMSPAEADWHRKIISLVLVSSTADRQTEDREVIPLCQLANTGDTKKKTLHLPISHQRNGEILAWCLELHSHMFRVSSL